MFIANILTRSQIFKLDGYNYGSLSVSLSVHICKYLNSMAITIKLNKKTAINIEFNFGLY